MRSAAPTTVLGLDPWSKLWTAVSSPCSHSSARGIWFSGPCCQKQGRRAEHICFFSYLSQKVLWASLIGWFPIAVKQKGFYVSHRYVMSFSKQIRRQPGLAALSHYLATAWHPGSSKRCAMTALQLSQSCAGRPSQALQRVQSQLHPGRILLCLRESCWKQQLYDFWEVWGSFASVKSRNTDFQEGSVSFKDQSLEHRYWRQHLWYVIWG